jgi:hypothetical protein
MNLRPIFMAGLLAVSTSAYAQTVRTEPEVITTGEVIRYVPGQTIVIRRPDQRTATYTLSTETSVPADVQVGRSVSLFTESAPEGSTVVKRVTTSRMTSGGVVEETTTETEAVTGEIVRYAPGETIVIRRPAGSEVTYALPQAVVVPQDIQVGRTVTIVPEEGPDGTTVVKKVKTTSITPEGHTKEITEETRTSATGETSRSATTTVSGVVSAYESGKTVTVTRRDGSKVAYILSPQTRVPADLAVGKVVTVQVESGSSVSAPRASTIIYTR